MKTSAILLLLGVALAGCVSNPPPPPEQVPGSTATSDEIENRSTEDVTR